MYDHELQHVPVVVTTSDKYLPALLPYIYLTREYWSRLKQFKVMGFSQPEFELPKNFEFISVGKFEDYPVERWTDAVIKFLEEHLENELFILMLEDYWITRRVSDEAISLAAAYMERHPNIIKFDLCADRLYAGGAIRGYDTFGFLDIVKSDPTSAYHMSLMTGMWRKSLLLELLKQRPSKGWSPHDVEITGTTRLQRMEHMIVVGSEQWPIRHTLGLRALDHTKLKLEELKQGDVHAMTRLGYFAPWGIT